MVRESEVESYLRRKAESYGGKCIKILPDYSRGIPDRLMMLPGGITIWVETKRPVGGRLSSYQLVRHRELRALGQQVEVVWSKAEADGLFEKLCADKKKTPDT